MAHLAVDMIFSYNLLSLSDSEVMTPSRVRSTVSDIFRRQVVAFPEELDLGLTSLSRLAGFVWICMDFRTGGWALRWLALVSHGVRMRRLSSLHGLLVMGFRCTTQTFGQ